MTKHERNLLPAGDVPALDGAAEAITPAATDRQVQQPEEYPGGINPRWDVAQIATRGHVLVGRLEYIFENLRAFMLWLWLVFLVLLWLTFKQGEVWGPNIFGALQRPLAAALTFEPDDYFDIGGGLKSGPEIAWLGDYAPTPESLSVADYEALIVAVGADSAKYGTNVDGWEHVGPLKVQPRITRPAKVFDDKASELRNGVVAVPEEGRDIIIVAYVEAKWAFAIVRSGQCATFVGPAVKACSDQTRDNGRWDSMAVEYINALKPKE
ncbi:hypothetical protein NKY66_10820 [Sinorhizobium meliloti]|uniref:hypothetical protein n=1 Tax=Rhizobium meliloti TaxID=382 RepID=UPI003D65C032